MSMPGYTAEASLRSSGRFSHGRRWIERAEILENLVIPADCQGDCYAGFLISTALCTGSTFGFPLCELGVSGVLAFCLATCSSASSGNGGSIEPYPCPPGMVLCAGWKGSYFCGPPGCYHKPW